MRVLPWIAAALVLSLGTPAFAQEEWDNFKFPEDGFEVNFPGKPTVEMVMRRWLIPRPCESLATSSATSSESRFASGSPMPITTM